MLCDGVLIEFGIAGFEFSSIFKNRHTRLFRLAIYNERNIFDVFDKGLFKNIDSDYFNYSLAIGQ